MKAVELVEQNCWGQIAVLRDGRVTGAPLQEAVATYRRVDPEGELVAAARAVGIEMGG